MSVFSSGLITFWLRTPGRHWKKICHVTLMRWPVTAGRLHFCHVHQPFFGDTQGSLGHISAKKRPPQKGAISKSPNDWNKSVRGFFASTPKIQEPNWILTSATRGFFFHPAKGEKQKKTTETRCETLGFLASKFPGGKAGEGAYPGATPSRLPPTPQWSHETLNKRPRDVLPMRGEGLWRPNFWERPKKSIRAELFVGGNLCFLWFRFLKTFEIFFANPTPKCWSLGQKDSGQTFVGDSSKNQRKWRRFTFGTALSATQRFPLFHTLMVWIFWADREVQAGINEKKGPIRSCVQVLGGVCWV